MARGHGRETEPDGKDQNNGPNEEHRKKDHVTETSSRLPIRPSQRFGKQDGYQREGNGNN